MRNVQGYTLVELIITLIMLAIISITATMQLLNFQKDARIASLKEIKAELTAAFSAFSYKVKTSGKSYFIKDIEYFDINGESIIVNPIDDYPVFSFEITKVKREISTLATLNGKFNFHYWGDSLYITPGKASYNNQCALEYRSASNNSKRHAPKISEIVIHIADC